MCCCRTPLKSQVDGRSHKRDEDHSSADKERHVQLKLILDKVPAALDGQQAAAAAAQQAGMAPLDEVDVEEETDDAADAAAATAADATAAAAVAGSLGDGNEVSTLQYWYWY